MDEPNYAIITTNIINIVLIVIFIYYRSRVKLLESLIGRMCKQLGFVTACCAKVDYKEGLISKEIYVSAIMNQPLDDMGKVAFLKAANIEQAEGESIIRGLKNVQANGDDKQKDS